MYSAPERRTPPSELRVLYEVQPDVRDVIVEGRVDRRLVSWYLHERGGGRARVYAVDDRIDSVLDLAGLQSRQARLRDCPGSRSWRPRRAVDHLRGRFRPGWVWR